MGGLWLRPAWATSFHNSITINKLGVVVHTCHHPSCTGSWPQAKSKILPEKQNKAQKQASGRIPAQQAQGTEFKPQ
jgi:hypothetical protein